MKFKKILLLICLIICLFSMASVCASEANDTAMASEDTNQMELSSSNVTVEDNLKTSEEQEIVTQTDNEKMTGASDSGTFADLQAKIDAAGNDSVINLENNYSYEGSFSNKGIIIPYSLTINGNGFAIDALHQSRIFNISASNNVTLNNITFLNGYSDLGGAILFEGSVCKIVIENCKFINNTATINGGAVYANATFMNNSIINSQFISNTAAKNGGAIYVLSSSNENLFENISFSKNRADGADGGAINFHGALSNTTFKNLTFSYNHAKNGGGAINTDNDVNDNNEYINSRFFNNTAKKGGALSGYGYSNHVFFDYCLFINNSVSNRGGAIYYERNIEKNVFDHCAFVTNSAGDNGGAIYSYRNSNYNSYFNIRFISNTATNNGGAIYNRGYSDTDNYKNVSFISNSALSVDGGCINSYANMAGVTFDNVTFENNSAAGNGGAINVDDVAKYTTFVNTRFINNTAGKNGGALSFVDSKRNKLDNAIFIQNRANINGSAIQILKSMLDDNIIESSFIDNHAKGAVISAGNVSNCDFQAVFMNNTGEAIIFLNAVNNTCINNSILLNNAAKSAIAVNISNGLAISNSIFINTVSEYEIRCAEGLDANYNWFGNNATDYKARPNMNNMNYDTWLFLNATADHNILTVHETSKIMFMLYYYNSTSNETSEYRFYYPVNLTVTATGGNVKDTAKLNETLTYTATTRGTGSVTASIGDASCTVELEIAKANSTLAVENMTFDYNSEGSANVSFSNALGVVANVVDHPEANVTVKGNTITVSNLAAGSYALNVTTIVDDDHNPVTVNATITVNKLQTEITANAITATYNVNKYLVIILKDSKGNTLSGATVIVNLNGVKNYTADENGTIKVSTLGLATGNYDVIITFAGNENYSESNATSKVTVNKDTTKITANPVTTTYQVDKYLIITLKDSQDKALNGVKVTVDLNGAKTYIADKNGQIIINVAKLVPNTYTAKITFNGNDNYDTSTQNVKVVVKKAKAKITAKKKTFKKSKKIKKYTITLKSGKNPIKKAKITIKIGKKTYKAKTNAKGKAVFKIKKLTKKGKYKATIKFAGNKYYNKVTKKVKITVK